MYTKCDLLFSGGLVETAWIPEVFAIKRKRFSVVDRSDDKVWGVTVLDILDVCDNPSLEYPNETIYEEIIPF